MGSRKGVALSRQPRRSGPRAAPRRLSEAQWAGIRRIMAAADVITPLARLDEALLLRLGMRPHDWPAQLQLLRQAVA